MTPLMEGSIDETRAGPDTPATAPTGAADATLPSGADAASATTLESGAAVGRYVVLSKIGAGAMGVVYAAYDPELDRRLALKLLRSTGAEPHDPGPSGDRRRTRLVREAQALARLAHPNIVTVHDVGTVDGQVFLAMEFIDGRTLATWLRGSRPWAEIVSTLTAAGRGLAAAHAAGLLHRDFKPDNVMIGSDDRVRVMDFGLARAREHGLTDSSSPEHAHEERDVQARTLEEARSHGEKDALAMQVTQAGALLGTPAYMAPEVIRGEQATAASDQFSFCVALWEALYGVRPFAGRTLVELAAALLSDKPPTPPKNARARAVPRWLERVCRRGLTVDPDRRFASIDDLLDGFERGRARARRGRVFAGAAAVAVRGGGLEGARRLDVAQTTRTCEDEGQRFIAESWNDAAKTELREGLIATGASYARTTADKVTPWFDRQAAAWAEARTEVCMNTKVRRTWSADLQDRARWCLDERRMAFDALRTELSKANEKTLQKAVGAAAKLQPVAACHDADRLRRLPAPPAEREKVETVRRELSRAAALRAARRSDEALEVAEQALAQAESIAWPPLVADGRARLGRILESLGRFEDAEAAFEGAYFQAMEAGSLDVAADVAISLIYTIGYKRAHHEEGLQWARHAETALELLGEADGSLRWAMLRNNVAIVHRALGEYEKAQSLHERALEIREALLVETHPDVAASLNNLANVRWARGDQDEAKQLFERSLPAWEAALGADHPTVAKVLNNLANVYRATSDWPRAKALHERALEIREAALAPDHPSIATSIVNLATVHDDMQEWDRARELYEASIPRLEAALGPEHPHLGYPLIGLAGIALAQSRPGDAVPLATRGLQVRESANAPAAALAEARIFLARALWDAPSESGRDRERARRLAKMARDLWAETEGASEAITASETWLAAHGAPL
jgi:tetratricopeptide (TPR) repeat protein/tRNA A-37 threonylcarbamoyl transferase component Bud32